MPTNEKEYNGYLFDQLEIVEDALELARKENAEETVRYLERKQRHIERKLYQRPPLISSE